MKIRAPIITIALSFSLVVYSARIITIYRMFTEEVTTTSSKLAAVIQIGLNLLLFVYGGHNIIKSADDERSEKKTKKEDQAIKLRLQQLQQWLPSGKLSEKLQNCIKEYQQYNWIQTGGVDIENLFINLPKDVTNNVKRELSLDMIKKVERFRRWSDALLLHLCDCVKPVVYAERTHIVREGDPINEMLFVLQGASYGLFPPRISGLRTIFLLAIGERIF